MSALPKLSPGQGIEDLIDPDSDFTIGVERSIEAARLRRLVTELPVLEQRIVRWHYGLEDEPLALREIARRLGMARMTVARVHERALVALRAGLDGYAHMGADDVSHRPARLA